MTEFGHADRQAWFDPNEANRRFEYLKEYLDNFSKSHSNQEDSFQYQPDAAKVINNIYWRYVSEHIKEYLKEKKNSTISAFKISSCTELSIMLVNPIIHFNKVVQAQLNAKLAFYVALSILSDWHKIDEEKISAFMAADDELSKFKSEHLKWLALLDPKYEFPVFSNSQTWSLLEYIALKNH